MKRGICSAPFLFFSAMKNKIIILLFSILPMLVYTQNNSVEINGWTNVNTFKCSNPNFKKSTSIYSFSGNQLPNINLQVQDFDCRNKMMTSDFRKTLNAEKYPVLTIKFLSFSKISQGRYSAVVEVKMMNANKKYTIEFTDDKEKLTGIKRLKFSDFKIVPPKKMGGMVYVKDEIDLRFSLALTD